MRNLSAPQLQAYLQQGHQPLLLDVREAWEYEICHLADSQLVPMRDIPTHISTLDKQQETVVICHHGIRSLQVARFLEYSGFSNIINLQGGVAAWAEYVDPSMPVY